jgi:AraC family transcriptional regulator
MIETRNLPQMRVLCMRHRGPYHTIGETFGKFWQAAGPRGVRAEYDLAMYLDSPREVAEADLRSDAGCVVADDLTFDLAVDGDPQPGDFHFLTIPASRFAVSRHVGSYSGLKEAWDGAFAEIHAQGLEVTDVACLEMYMNDCTKVSEDELITDIHISIR